MKIDKEDAMELIDGLLDDWKMIEKKIVSNSRWSIKYEGVFKHLESDRFYKLQWSQGSTEQQDERPFQYKDPELVEVYPTREFHTVYSEEKEKGITISHDDISKLSGGELKDWKEIDIDFDQEDTYGISFEQVFRHVPTDLIYRLRLPNVVEKHARLIQVKPVQKTITVYEDAT